MKNISTTEIAMINGAGSTGENVAGAMTGAVITGISTAVGSAIAGPVGAIVGSAIGAGTSAVVKDNLATIGKGLGYALETASKNQHRHDILGGGMPIAFQ